LAGTDLGLIKPDRQPSTVGSFMGFYIGSDLPNDKLVEGAVGEKKVPPGV